MKCVFIATAGLFFLACSSCDDDGDASSSGASENAGDEALIVPAGLTVTALPGGSGVLDMVALTLRQGQSNIEIYAALKNTGDTPACSAAFSAELFDEGDQSLAAGIGGLLTQHFYRLTDGSGNLAACVAPGEVTMAAVTDLPSDIDVDDVGRVVYRCPYFALDVAPLDGLAIRQLKRVARRDGTVYTGTLVNGFDDAALCNPSVRVFPVNRMGRPLGMAISRGTDAIPPAESWAFETNAVDVEGADSVAYPAGELADEGCPTAAERR